jgi:hypothetical protein
MEAGDYYEGNNETEWKQNRTDNGTGTEQAGTRRCSENDKRGLRVNYRAELRGAGLLHTVGDG